MLFDTLIDITSENSEKSNNREKKELNVTTTILWLFSLHIKSLIPREALASHSACVYIFEFVEKEGEKETERESNDTMRYKGFRDSDDAVVAYG